MNVESSSPCEGEGREERGKGEGGESGERKGWRTGMKIAM